ncbi:MAG: type II toxin-antitoxin system RelE/ParE family toxin [Jatrophihabitantaceae bacterium]
MNAGTPEPDNHVPDEARWTVLLAASAIRDLDLTPPRVAPAIIEFLYGPLAANPRRVGKPLRDDFGGSFGARRGTYRIRYDIEDAERTVRVFRVSSRAQAYRPR